MLGLGSQFMSSVTHIVLHRRNDLVIHRATGERVFVRDDAGYIELDLYNHDDIFGNPDIYIWESGHYEDGVMVYFFRLAQ